MPIMYIRVKLHPSPRRMEHDKTFARHSNARETVLVFLKTILIYSKMKNLILILDSFFP